MIVSISWYQTEALISGKEIVRVLVFINHPRIVFDSLSCPSARSFFKEIISLRGITSSEDSGLDIDLIASGIVLTTLRGAYPMSGATPIESSMKMSIFPASFSGILTDKSRA
jgi:hypothetical protein